MERPGSAEIRVAGSTPARVQALARHLGPGGLRRRRLTVDVRDAEPAPHDQFGQLERGEERADHLGRLLEGRRVEDLAADVCMDAGQFDGGHELECGNGVGGGPGGDGEAELRVLLPGSHELVCVRLDSGRDPHQDLRSLRSPGDGLQEATQAGDLVERVDDDPADALPQGCRQLVGRLVVAVKDEPLRRDAAGECDMELATGRDVEVHALLVGQTGHGEAQEGLGGIGDTVAPRRHRLTAGVAQMVLVVHEEGCAELLRQLQQVDAADVEVALLVDRRRAREEMPLQGRGRDVVVGRHGDAGYGSIRRFCEGGEGPRCVTSTIVPCFVTPAPVAQRIEHRPPEPVAQVRVLPGALCRGRSCAGSALRDLARHRTPTSERP